MKNILLITLTVISFAVNTHAQNRDTLKQTGGESNIEILFAPLDDSPIGIDGIKFRHFIDSQTALRAQLDISYFHTVNITRYENEELDLPELSNTSTNFSAVFSPGLEKHLRGTERLSPYFGGELEVGFQYSEVQVENEIEDEIETTTSSNNSLILGINGVFGFDYYFSRSIYLGAEAGYGARFNTQLVEGASNSYSLRISPNVIGRIRAGVLF